MGRRWMRSVGSLAVVAVLAMAVFGCGGGGGGGDQGGSDLSGAQLTVGSKEFTEQLVLGQIAIQALENAGAQVTDRTQITGTEAVRNALTSGEIDMYWEYTGTGWITFLGHSDTEGMNSQELFKQVAKEDLQENNVKWISPPAPANNTYAFAVRNEAYDQLGVEKISDFKTLLQENPQEATFCLNSEFTTRDDGMPGVQEAYGFEVPGDNITTLNSGQIYQAVAEGNRCNFGDVFATDGRIPALNLRIIEDDQNFFPTYNPAVTVSNDVYEQYPEIQEIFAPISEKLDTKTLQELNAKVDVEEQLPETVAQNWLRENGFID